MKFGANSAVLISICIILFANQSFAEQMSIQHDFFSPPVPYEGAIQLLVEPSFVTVTRRKDFQELESETRDSNTQIDLYRYPVLHLENRLGHSGTRGVQLGVKPLSQEQKEFRLNVGDPQFFPEFTKLDFDFQSTQMQPSNAKYALKRELALNSEKTWYYTTRGSKVLELKNGDFATKFDPFGTLKIQATMDCPSIKETPWLLYEFELPPGFFWLMNIEAKVWKNGSIFRPKILQLEKIRGSGKQRILANLLDQLKDQAKGTNDASLVELTLGLSIEGSALPEQIENVRFSFGRLRLFNSRFSRENSDLNSLFAATLKKNLDVNLYDFISATLGSKDHFFVSTAKLLENGIAASERRKPSEIQFHTGFTEQIPVSFFGNAALINDLSSELLSSVMDQKLFFQQNTLWQSGELDVVFRSPIQLEAPAIDFAVNLKLSEYSYILGDVVFDGFQSHPLKVIFTGTDINGKQATWNGTLNTGQATRIKALKHVNKISVGFTGLNPASFKIQNLQINEYSPSNKPPMNPIIAQIKLEPTDLSKWRANQERFEVRTTRDQEGVPVHTYDVNLVLNTPTRLIYDLSILSGRPIGFKLRTRYVLNGDYHESLHSLDLRGSIALPPGHLIAMDLFAFSAERITEPSTVFVVNKLSLISDDSKEFQKATFNVKQSMAKYHGQHIPLNEGSPNWLKLAYAWNTTDSTISNQEKLDVSLSYQDIRAGGRSLSLKNERFDKTEYLVTAAVSDANASVKLDTKFVAKIDAQKLEEKRKSQKDDLVLSPKTMFAMLLFVISAICAAYLLSHKWLAPFDRFLKVRKNLIVIEFLILVAAISISSVSPGQDKATRSGLLVLLGYSLFVRYRLRRFIELKFPKFTRRLSAPYYLLLLVMLILSVLAQNAHNSSLADTTAVYGFYSFAIGVIIDFIEFAKASKTESTIESNSTLRSQGAKKN